ncbi:MAG: FeoB-associated Cys-rich membrane protein [Lachnospiraceae bacterium]|nr:FeoB-associated Cys-rich membrane protein [Lachnospiraceae bacterium]
MEWFRSNIANVLIVLILICLVGLAVRVIIRNKRSGKSSCGCDCCNCPVSDGCHKPERK